MPAHTHSLPLTDVGPAGGGYVADFPKEGTGYTSGSTGGGTAHNNVQPTLVLNYIIKT